MKQRGFRQLALVMAPVCLALSSCTSTSTGATTSEVDASSDSPPGDTSIIVGAPLRVDPDIARPRIENLLAQLSREGNCRGLQEVLVFLQTSIPAHAGTPKFSRDLLSMLEAQTLLRKAECT
jgi:hypothetical protein